MAACPFLTGMWTFRCLARTNFIIPTITEETRYCLSKHPERCPHYPEVGPEKTKNQAASQPVRSPKVY
jgi:hypothetical protein